MQINQSLSVTAPHLQSDNIELHFITYVLRVKHADPDHPAGQSQVNGATHFQPFFAQAGLHSAAKD